MVSYIGNGNGTHHVTQAVRSNARLHQLTPSKVNDLRKFTLHVKVKQEGKKRRCETLAPMSMHQ